MTTTTSKPQCLDCKREGITTFRKATGKPLLCRTHRIVRRDKRRNYSHDKHIGETYGITTQEYQSIYEFQGGRCYICRRATGAKKRLSVDHDHVTGMVRGCLCTMCNKYILGHARDDVAFFERAIEYLKFPPAVEVIGCRIVPLTGAPVKPSTERRDGAKPTTTGGGDTEILAT